MAQPTQSPLIIPRVRPAREGGFALVQGLVLMGVVAILVVVLQSVFSKGIQQESGNAAVAELESIFGDAATVLRRKETCAKALAPLSFPNPKVNHLTVFFPKVDQNQTPTDVLIKYDSPSDTGRVKITDISVGLPSGSAPIGSDPSTGKTAYLGTFTLEAQIPVKGTRPFIRQLPIYLVKDSSGALVECRITKITKPVPAPGLTLEDEVCRGISGASPTSIYNPAADKCT